MIKTERKIIRPLVKRGNCIALHFPQDLLARLGWNKHDNIYMQPVDGALVLTKVKLPSVEHLRSASSTEREEG